MEITGLNLRQCPAVSNFEREHLPEAILRLRSFQDTVSCMNGTVHVPKMEIMRLISTQFPAFLKLEKEHVLEAIPWWRSSQNTLP